MFDSKTPGDEIFDLIYNEYIYNCDLDKSSQVLKNLSALVENRIAYLICSSDDLLNGQVCSYNIASYYICKKNKKNKKYLKNKEMIDQWAMLKNYADENPELSKIKEYALDTGTYTAELKDDTFLIFIVDETDKKDPYYISTKLYFIGYKADKYRKKYLKLVHHYNDLKNNDKDEVIIYSNISKGAKTTKFRSFDNLIMNNKEEVIKYIDKWVTNIPEFYKRDIIPKLSILLYGKPGTGKSSFYKALANHLGIKRICSISPDYFINTDGRNRMMSYSQSDEPTIYVIDDIDCICNSRDNDITNNNSIILSSLLEFLDNPNTCYFKAKDGKYYPCSIVVATTNYYDKLDKAVSRYGRFDYQIHMTDFNKKSAEEMCETYGLSLTDVIDEDKINDDFSISPAKLQALCHKNIEKSLKNNE